MKKYLMIITAIISILILGMLLQYLLSHYLQSPTDNSLAEVSQSQKPLYWVAPMDPTYRRDKPGKSPMGMDLVPVYEDAETTEGIRIAPEVEQNLGVRTAKVVRRDLPRQIDTVGYIVADENRIEHIHTYTDGWIKRLLVKTTGEHVKKGELLLELYSPLLVNAQEEYLLAMNSNNKRLVEASHKRLLTLGMDESQINTLQQRKQSMQLVKIFAGQSGIVSELMMREGMYVKPDTDLMTLEDLSHIWVLAEVFEKQSQWVKEGQPARASLPYLPGKQWNGDVEYVYPRLNPTTHTLTIRLQFDNPDEVLKPNMYANVTIFASPEKNVLAIPRQAVIYRGDGAHVIVSLGEGRYKAKPVTLGIESGDFIAVLSGLNEGEQVVTSAQFLIDSESSLKASFDRLESTGKTSHSH